MIVPQCQMKERKQEVCIVFFDVSKAFNKVPHLPLLHQMQEMNLNPYLMRWLKDYLSDRYQAAVVEGEISSNSRLYQVYKEVYSDHCHLIIMYILTTLLLSSHLAAKLTLLRMILLSTLLSHHQVTMQYYSKISMPSLHFLTTGILTLMKTNVAQCLSLGKGPTHQHLHLYTLIPQNLCKLLDLVINTLG